MVDIFPKHCYYALVRDEMRLAEFRSREFELPMRIGSTQREIFAYARRKQGILARLQAQCARFSVA